MRKKTQRYQDLCRHYGMEPTRNNRGVSQENGAVESPHGHVKRRIKQGLLLRGSKDFDTLDAYRQWLDRLIRQSNKRRAESLEIERSRLQDLPTGRTTDFTEEVVTVTSHSTIDVKRVLYTVPARLVGERLRMHIYDDRLEGYIDSQKTLALPRVRVLKHNQRARRVDYRHVIGHLARKPQAFRYSQLRDDLLPSTAYQPMVVTLLQSNIATGQLRPTDTLVALQDRAKPGTLTVRMEPLWENGLEGIVPGAKCIANAYSNYHQQVASGDLGTVASIYYHMVDAVGIVHAAILRVQALITPVKLLVFSGH